MRDSFLAELVAEAHTPPPKVLPEPRYGGMAGLEAAAAEASRFNRARRLA